MVVITVVHRELLQIDLREFAHTSAAYPWIELKRPLSIPFLAGGVICPCTRDQLIEFALIRLLHAIQTGGTSVPMYLFFGQIGQWLQSITASTSDAALSTTILLIFRLFYWLPRYQKKAIAQSRKPESSRYKEENTETLQSRDIFSG